MKISVVTVCRNSAATIADTVASFVTQTHREKEMIVIDGLSTDGTLDIVRGFHSPDIRIVSERDLGPFDAMNKGLRLHSGDAVGVLNSDDTFHDNQALKRIAAALENADIAYGDLDMVRDHESKTVVRAWRAGRFRNRAFQLGWMPPHPTFYVRRIVIDRVGGFDIAYRLAADYDLMLRAMTLFKFRVRYIPHVLVDFKLGGLSSLNLRATLEANLECLRSRQAYLNAWLVDAALFLRPLRRIFQLRRIDGYYRS